MVKLTPRQTSRARGKAYAPLATKPRTRTENRIAMNESKIRNESKVEDEVSANRIKQKLAVNKSTRVEGNQGMQRDHPAAGRCYLPAELRS
jgi:hypothetical protein